MSERENVARRWHEGSDHAADGTPFGGGLCNCLKVAERLEVLLAEERATALRDAADALEAERDEHEAEDRAEGCDSRFCGGWMLGQTYAANRLRTRADEETA